MASPAYTQLTKIDDLEAGSSDHNIGGVEKFELGGITTSEAEQPHPENVSTAAAPGKEAGRVSLFFWIAVNTLATIAIVYTYAVSFFFFLCISTPEPSLTVEPFAQPLGFHK